MTAKEIYKSIMCAIHFKERSLRPDQELRISLLEFPQLEIKEIGRVGGEYLLFTGHSAQGIDTTLLLPPSPPPMRFDILCFEEVKPSKPRKTIGFLADVGDNR